MKHIFCLLIVALGFFSASAQPIIYKNDEVKDLKECVSKYTTVFWMQNISKSTTLVSTDEGLAWSFAEPDGSKKKFSSIIDLFNFMDKSGWRYVDKIEDGIMGKMVYLFEKKEK